MVRSEAIPLTIASAADTSLPMPATLTKTSRRSASPRWQPRAAGPFGPRRATRLRLHRQADPLGAGARQTAATRRVLVVDDEPAIRRFLARVLDAAGYEAVAVEDGPKALDAAADGRLDAILCDQQMPGMSGTDVYEAITRARPALASRFVLMSGDVDHPELLAFATPRGIGLLSKPFDIPAVTAAVRRSLDTPVAERA